jgi:hypothetical protein
VIVVQGDGRAFAGYDLVVLAEESPPVVNDALVESPDLDVGRRRAAKDLVLDRHGGEAGL